MARHPPAHRRDIIRRLKDGEPPARLLEDARTVADPGHAAAALLAITSRLSPKEMSAIVDEATQLLQSVERVGRMAEAWSDALSMLPGGKHAEAARHRCIDAAVDAICDMPDGQWTADAIVAVAPHVDTLEPLMVRALANKGCETDAVRALLKIDPSLEPVVRAGPPDVAAYVLDDAIGHALRVKDPTARREALRVAIWKMDAFPETIEAEPEDLAHIMTIIGAREDRLGRDPAPRFAAAQAAIDEAPEETRPKLLRKLSAAMERAGAAPVDTGKAEADVPKPVPRPASDAEVIIPVKPSDRHSLALVDAYTGGLGPAHLRAIARAAPLAVAFDLDLVLMGFPTDDLANLVDVVERDTNVGEGAPYARQLIDSGRLRLFPLEHGIPDRWPGTPVATTPHPAEGKACKLAAVEAPICLLVGLGKQGLPRKILDAVAHHHELTGQGISLETATAMGILADRLAQVPLTGPAGK